MNFSVTKRPFKKTVRGTEASRQNLFEIERKIIEAGSRGGLLVAVRDNCIVGFLTWFCDQDLLEAVPEYILISDIVVTQAERRSGVGSALLSRVKQIAIKFGISRICLSVLAKNHEAQEAYQALGGRIVAYSFEFSVPKS